MEIRLIMAAAKSLQYLSDNMAKKDKKNLVEIKTIGVILLVVLALAISYYFLGTAKKPETLAYDKGSPVPTSVFAANLQNAENIVIVMDIRNNPSEMKRGNIMQCGTDFAGSQGLVGKNITAYALEGEECLSIDGNMNINDCIKNALSGTAIFIMPGNGSTLFYEKKMIVGMGENYTFRECGIAVKNNTVADATTPVNISDLLPTQ